MVAARIAFSILSLLIFGGLNYFLFRRLIADLTDRPWVKRGLAVVLIGVYAAVPLLRWWGAEGLPPSEASFAVLALWGLLLNVMLVLVAIEVTRFIAKFAALRSTPKPAEVVDDPARRQFIARVGAATALSVGGGLTTFGVYKAMTAPETTEVSVKLPGLPKALEGFTIVHLSDIHVGAVIQEKFLDVLVSEANRAKPDLIAITGDLVDGSPDMLGRYVARLRNLSSKYGTHFCSGNHDYYSGWERWAQVLPGIGFTVLRNRSVVIGDQGASFDLLGVDDYGRFGGSGGGYDLDAATSGLDPARASVLLAHQPVNLEAVAAKHIGLQLSGHTHGGQLFPGTIVGSMIWGDRNAGLSRHDGTWLYTSRGCGFVGPPMRVGAPPEVVKLVLTSA